MSSVGATTASAGSRRHASTAALTILRKFVDEAHGHGLGVVLDVVYNHLGPDGNYLARFAREYFTDRYSNEWGEALNFDGAKAAAVRELVLANVEYLGPRVSRRRVPPGCDAADLRCVGRTRACRAG